ncbi:MAG: tripartite tricarboxylate transporter substrate binding protein [Betaproteobacteria bacterium]|nr:tripartite tricarboxylate transporter substrate binding protein [Betaproteobacteria bacterium]
MKRGLHLAIGIFSALLLAGFAGHALAQKFPAKPIRIIMPFPPGGPTDSYARMVAHGLAQNLGQQVLVDNRTGASGIIGSEIVAKSPPDGYTLLFTATHHTINPSLYKSLPYDTERDFTPLTLVATNPNVLAASPSFPANTIAELIALARAKPGQLNYASTSIGGGNHLSAELMKSMAGIDIVHIPYKGQPQAMNDLLGGQVSLMFTSVGLTVPHMKSGKLKALAVTGAKRVANLPDVPTIGETIPGYEANSWFGMWGPARMAKELVAQLNGEIVRVLRSPEVTKRFAALDAEVGGSTPEQFAAFQKSELLKWAKLVKALGLKLD